MMFKNYKKKIKIIKLKLKLLNKIKINLMKRVFNNNNSKIK